MIPQSLRARRQSTDNSAGELASLEHLPQLLQALPIAALAFDTLGRVLGLNDRARTLLDQTVDIGASSEHIFGSVKIHQHHGQVGSLPSIVTEVIRGGVPVRSAEALVRCADGSEMWIDVQIDPIRCANGAIAGAVACFHQPEHSARADTRWTTAAYEHAAVGIAKVDGSRHFRNPNSCLCTTLNSSFAELDGASISSFIHPDDCEAEQAFFDKQMKGELASFELELRLRRAPDDYVWVSLTSKRVDDIPGTAWHALWTVRDLSSQKAAEKRLEAFSISQAALHALTASLQRAPSRDEACAAAIEAIIKALRCSRASVLFFDDSGVMRFACSRGLTDRYMHAVEGHSPWDATTRGARPICIEDVSASDLPEELKQAIRKEGIEALAFIPVEGNDRLLGKFMVYFDEPHAYSRAEIETALTVARHVSFSLERLRSDRAAQHLAAIVKSSWDAIVSKDTNGIITSWNDAAEHLFGYQAADVIGKPITILIPPERLDEEALILKRIRAGVQVPPFETVRRRSNGELIDISLTISPILDGAGNIVGASKIARDISDRKLAERRLSESEQRLRDLLSAIPAAIYTTDADGRLTYFNEAAVAFSGRRPALGIDRWCVTWKLYKPDGQLLPHDECPMAMALKEGRAIRGVEAVAERPDGTRVPFIPYPTPLRDSSGKIVGAINMLVDISQRKEAETQQRLLLHELNHRVKNNMQMLQALLARSARRATTPEARYSLEEASTRVAALASAQRVLYGQSGGQLFASDQLVQEVCDTARQAFPGSILVSCDAERLELQNDVAMPLALILNELLTNAVKHGTNGSQSAEVRVLFRKDLDEIALSVEDDGPGFDLKATRPSSSGIRLVEGIARQLNGRIEVNRAPRTKVTLRFPQGAHSSATPS